MGVDGAEPGASVDLDAELEPVLLVGLEEVADLVVLRVQGCFEGRFEAEVAIVGQQERLAVVLALHTIGYSPEVGLRSARPGETVCADSGRGRGRSGPSPAGPSQKGHVSILSSSQGRGFRAVALRGEAWSRQAVIDSQRSDAEVATHGVVGGQGFDGGQGTGDRCGDVRAAGDRSPVSWDEEIDRDLSEPVKAVEVLVEVRAPQV